jgi:Ca2+-binding RTX toxin-like protein
MEEQMGVVKTVGTFGRSIGARGAGSWLRRLTLCACLASLLSSTAARAQLVFYTNGVDTTQINNYEWVPDVFQQRPSLPAGVDTLGRFAVGDLDGDGSFEIVVTGSTATIGRLHVFTYIAATQSYLARGEFTFSDPDVNQGELAIGDLDGDQRDEVVLVPFGTTPPGPRPETGGDDSLFIVDFASVAPLQAQAFEIENQFITPITNVLVADIYGAGDVAELALLTQNEGGLSNDSEALGSGTIFICSPQLGATTDCPLVNSFFVDPSPTDGRFPTSAAAGDLNGDGVKDLAIGYGSGCPGYFDQGVRVYESALGGAFPPPLLPLLALMQQMTVADVDGDGMDELVAVLNGQGDGATIGAVATYHYNDSSPGPFFAQDLAILPLFDLTAGEFCFAGSHGPGFAVKPPTYVAATKPVDVCNGEDDDGDGAVDEDHAAATVSCPGLTACASTSTVCQSGVVVQDPPCPVLGPCALPGDHPTCPGASGTIGCAAVSVACIPNSAGTVDDCGGGDGDCDGTIDEDFGPVATNCGVLPGICQNTTTTQCQDGAVVAGPCEGGLEPTDEVPCNELDDDCDGTVDDGSPPPGEVCGALPGACAGRLATSCVDGGVVVGECEGESAPAAETPFDCIDNSCNGQTDECAPGQPDWYCQCTPGTDLVFQVDLNDDGLDADAEAANCLPGDLATGVCRLRGVFRQAELLGCMGCRVVAQLGSSIYHTDDELRLARGNLVLEGVSSEETIITTSASCADEACTALDCRDAGCGPQCGRDGTHRLINAVAEDGQASFLELRSLTLRGGRNTLTGSGSIGSSAAGGVALSDGGLILDGVVVRDNIARGVGTGVAVGLAQYLIVTDSVVADNVNEQAVTTNGRNCEVDSDCGTDGVCGPARVCRQCETNSDCAGGTCNGSGVCVRCTAGGDAGGLTGMGGGIWAGGVDTVEITRSAIVRNKASDAGGMMVNSSGAVSISNSTFAQNEGAGRGGGLRVYGGSSLSLEFNSFIRNLAGNGDAICDNCEFGAGIDIQQSPDPRTVSAFGNIFAENEFGTCGDCTFERSPDCHFDAGVTLSPGSQGLNLVGTGGMDCSALGDPAADPLIGEQGSALPAGILGVPGTDIFSSVTQVNALQTGSPAVDAYPADASLPVGAPECPVDDQRRAIRPQTGPCSLGAYELNGMPDSDIDGIPDELDPTPFAFSNFFSDGVSNGEITTRGDQTVIVHDLDEPEGVVVEALPGGGSAPAEITACGGTLQVSLAAGESVTINCPFADAGPDQVVECMSDGHADVELDGTGSYAVSGSLSYAWSAPGVTLEDADQSIARGSFPVGTTTVTLEVSDGTAGAEDSALVTVLDTTPPILNIPADVTTATCSGVNIGQAVAVDLCGGAVTILNVAPASFKAGAHTVTWRAIDQSGNETVKTQKVIVGLGDSTACCPAGTNVIVGTASSNTLNGTSGSDCILGRGAQDTIKGFGGNDYLSGGEGNDTIEGGDGNDFIDGGTGQDQLKGQNGNDTILGGDGDDGCWGGNNDDTIHGGQGQDQVLGESGNDSLFGDIGDDTLNGSSGDDLLNGGGLHDQCSGGTGTNTYLLCDNQPGSSGPLQASFQVTSDWGSGYCVGLSATNPTAQNATSWGVTFQLTNANISTSSNGLYNGATGTITVLPSMSSNQELSPGETDATIGFCANRTVSGSPPPSVLFTAATFE